MVLAPPTPAQTQLISHVLAWGNLRMSELAIPYSSAPELVRSGSASPSPLPSERLLQFIDRLKRSERPLLAALGVNQDDMEREVASREGPSFNSYLWNHRLAWITGATGPMGRMAADDLWQIRQGRLNVHQRVMQWKRAFGGLENAQSRVNVMGLDNNLSWVHDTYERRHDFVTQLRKKHRTDWEMVAAFYDPAQRAAQNILDGAAALAKYLKIKAAP